MSSPRRSLLLLAPAAAVAALTASGCAIGDTGPRTTQTRDVASFTRIDNNGSIDVRLHVGQPQRVRVVAGRKVIDDVRTEVRDGTLRVDFDHHGFEVGDVVVEASVPKLTAIQASGSGDIDADGLDSRAFDVRSDGSADIALRGSVDRLAVDLDGSGDGKLSGLTAHTATVSVSGSGDVEVRADRRLDVDVEGSGDVHYYGNPAMTRRIDGSGDVSREEQ